MVFSTNLMAERTKAECPTGKDCYAGIKFLFLCWGDNTWCEVLEA